MRKVLVTVLWVLAMYLGVYLMSSPAPGMAQNVPLKKVRIGVSIPAADHGWTAGVGWWAKRAMALYPDIEWSFATAATPEKQVADIEDMMNKGVDGLVILATESAPLTEVAERAHDRGIHIVNVDRGFLKRWPTSSSRVTISHLDASRPTSWPRNSMAREISSSWRESPVP